MKDENMMAAQPVGSWLEDLASAAPAPGGGAAAGLNVAVGAALIEMVCNLTIGKPKYAAYEATMSAALERARSLRDRALRLAEEDAEAFAGVSAAYKLPRQTDDEKAARTAAIQAALVGAADVPLRTAEAAAEVVELAGEILEGANVNVLSDVAVAASSARAGLDAATINVEINLAAMTDTDRRAAVTDRLAGGRTAIDDADRIVADVRHRISA